MSKRHWTDYHRVLGQALDRIFGKRSVSEENIDNEIRWLHALQVARSRGEA
jgi:hypothetical protein